jgi:acetyl esterase/lipase
VTGMAGPTMRRSSGRARSKPTCRVAKWLLLSAPTGYLTVVSKTVARVPVVGTQLQPLADAAAMGAWMYRQVPGFVETAARSKRVDAEPKRQRYSHRESVEACERSLRGLVSADTADWPPPLRRPPLLDRSELRRRYVYRADVPYGHDPAQVLDVWRARDAPPSPAPTLIYVPGGAWVHASRRYQGHTLLAHLAERGWLCLAIDYRVAPRHRWPRHIMDVKAAIAWTRANAGSFGGDPTFVTIAGASAGGHLATLAAVSPGDPVFDSELAGIDTAVDVAVSLYGRYDWEDRSTPERARFMGFLEHLIVRETQRSAPEVFRSASPIARIGEDTPPMLIVHGGADSVIPVGQAREFVEQLRQRSPSFVGYLELPGAQHAFDLIDGARTGVACSAVGRFLDAMYREHCRSLVG